MTELRAQNLLNILDANIQHNWKKKNMCDCFYKKYILLTFERE